MYYLKWYSLPESHEIPMHVKHTIQLNIQFPKPLLALVKMKRKKKSVSWLIMKSSSQYHSFWTRVRAQGFVLFFYVFHLFLFSVVLVYFSNQDLTQPGLTLSLLCGQGWLWTDLPAFASQVQEWRACTTTLAILCVFCMQSFYLRQCQPSW